MQTQTELLDRIVDIALAHLREKTGSGAVRCVPRDGGFLVFYPTAVETWARGRMVQVELEFRELSYASDDVLSLFCVNARKWGIYRDGFDESSVAAVLDQINAELSKVLKHGNHVDSSE
jgi:hypothetical protein